MADVAPARQERRPRTPAGRARRTLERLGQEYPGTARELCALDHRNPFELLAATILSAQCTDERVNMVTPHLFARYPTPEDLAVAEPLEVEEIIRSTGFYKNKTKSLIGMATGRRRALRRRGAERDGGPRHPPGRRPQDRQRAAQRRHGPARACPSTPTSAGCRAASASPRRPIR